jgi:hypothetical protein
MTRDLIDKALETLGLRERKEITESGFELISPALVQNQEGIKIYSDAFAHHLIYETPQHKLTMDLVVDLKSVEGLTCLDVYLDKPLTWDHPSGAETVQPDSTFISQDEEDVIKKHIREMGELKGYLVAIYEQDKHTPETLKERDDQIDYIMRDDNIEEKRAHFKQSFETLREELKSKGYVFDESGELIEKDGTPVV